jgi:hypothetical protein
MRSAFATRHSGQVKTDSRIIAMGVAHKGTPEDAFDPRQSMFCRAGQHGVMTTRRSFLHAAGAALAMLALPAARAQQIPLLTVYKSPACGCCGEWVEHMRTNGFRLQVRDVGDVTPIKRQYGVPDVLVSCHTAVVAGYAIEGHVPAADVKRLLRERPKLKGLAVPGMVPGSPGMQGTAQPYNTIAFDAAGSRIFERH